MGVVWAEQCKNCWQRRVFSTLFLGSLMSTDFTAGDRLVHEKVPNTSAQGATYPFVEFRSITCRASTKIVLSDLCAAVTLLNRNRTIIGYVAPSGLSLASCCAKYVSCIWLLSRWDSPKNLFQHQAITSLLQLRCTPDFPDLCTFIRSTSMSSMLCVQQTVQLCQAAKVQIGKEGGSYMYKINGARPRARPARKLLDRHLNGIH